MKIINLFKNVFCSVSYWFDCHFGPDRLSTLPRKIQSDHGTKKLLRDFRKLYYFSLKSNIAISGGETSGKKSFVKTIEKTRLFPVGKFLHIDIGQFIEECGQAKDLQSLQNDLDVYVENCIISRAKSGELPGMNNRLVRGSDRIYRRPLIASMIAIITGGLLSTMTLWSDWLINFLPNTFNEHAVRLVILISSIAIIALCFLSIIKSTIALWPLKWINKIKASSKLTELEIAVGNNNNRSEYNQTIIYVLCRLRWQIGHTVVFENLEALGDEAFQKTIAHLCGLNKRVNNHGNAWKLWDISPLRRPIRFLYIYRSDMVQLKKDKPFFDKEFYILPNLTVDNVFYELKKTFEIEVSKGAKIQIDKLFPFDPSYMAHVSKYLVNRRLLNEIVQHYILEHEDFISRTHAMPSENDSHKLFSFVVYGVFFPKDRAKFPSRSSVIFTNASDKCDFDAKYSDLFNYLVSTTCPKTYRIDYLCMRFVGLCPELIEEHIKCYELAYQKGDYQTARMYIEKALCCQPFEKTYCSQKVALPKMIFPKSQQNRVIRYYEITEEEEQWESK